MRPSGWHGCVRVVCALCGQCWDTDPQWHPVDTLACPGCPQRGRCESCPTWLVTEATREHELADGLRVVVRPLLHSDRFELAEGFRQLSDHSRHLRFFSPPRELTDDDLEYLTNLDYRDHYALGAFAVDEPGAPGIAVARYVRQGDTERAEAAVTVLDEYQRRGLGSLLMQELGAVATRNGVRRFVNYVSWKNDDAIQLLLDEGATVTPAEPGVARIELDLPTAGEPMQEQRLHRVLRTFADFLRQIFDPEDTGESNRAQQCA